jgi:hypothetical protein
MRESTNGVKGPRHGKRSSAYEKGIDRLNLGSNVGDLGPSRLPNAVFILSFSSP